MILTFEIPDEITAELGGSEQAISALIRADLAANYYEARLVSLGRAAELSGLRRWEFEALLARRRTVRDFDAEDLLADVAWTVDL